MRVSSTDQSLVKVPEADVFDDSCPNENTDTLPETMPQPASEFVEFAFSSKDLHICNLNIRLIVPKIDEIRILLTNEKRFGVVQCGGRKKSPRTSTIVQFIFHFRSFEISEGILRNQKLNWFRLHILNIYLFIYLDPIWIYIYISVFESSI